MTLSDTWVPKAPPLRVDDGGVVRVGKSRVTLAVLLTEFKQGATAEEIAESFDTVGLANVHAVISYYLDNQQTVDAYLAEVENAADATRKEIESQPGYAEWRDSVIERMRKRREARQESNP